MQMLNMRPPFPAALVPFLLCCGCSSTSVYRGDKLFVANRYGFTIIDVEFGVNEPPTIEITPDGDIWTMKDEMLLLNGVQQGEFDCGHEVSDLVFVNGVPSCVAWEYNALWYHEPYYAPHVQLPGTIDNPYTVAAATLGDRRWLLVRSPTVLNLYTFDGIAWTESTLESCQEPKTLHFDAHESPNGPTIVAGCTDEADQTWLLIDNPLLSYEVRFPYEIGSVGFSDDGSLWYTRDADFDPVLREPVLQRFGGCVTTPGTDALHTSEHGVRVYTWTDQLQIDTVEIDSDCGELEHSLLGDPVDSVVDIWADYRGSGPYAWSIANIDSTEQIFEYPYNPYTSW